MENSLIQSVEQTIEKSYADIEVTDFWEEIEGPSKEQSNDEYVEKILSVLKQATECVFIVVDDQLPSDILKIIPELFQKNVRVYILTNQFYRMYEETIVGHSLIRYSDKILGTMVLVDPLKETQIGLFSNSRSLTTRAGLNIVLELSNREVKEAYQYFCWNFWKRADYEVKNKGDVDQPREIPEPPYDFFPLLDPEYLCYNSPSRSYLTEKLHRLIGDAENEIIVSMDVIDSKITESFIGALESGVNLILYTTLNKDHLTHVREIAKSGGEVYGFPRNGNNFVIADNKRGFITIDSFSNENLEGFQQEFFGLHLKTTKINFLKKQIKEQYPTHRWQYSSTKTLGKIHSQWVIEENKTINYDSEQRTEVIDFQEITLEPVIAGTLRDLYDKKTQSMLKHDGLIKNVRYNWIINPQKRDANAKLDSLYQRWKNEYDKFKAYIHTLIEEANYSEERKKSLADKLFASMKKIFLVKQRKTILLTDTLNSLLETMEQKDQLRADELEELIEEANKVGQVILSQKNEIDEEIDYHQEKLHWTEKREKLIEERDDLESQVKSQAEQIKNLQRDFQKKENKASDQRKDLEESLHKMEGNLSALESKHPELIQKYEMREYYNQIFTILKSGIEEQNVSSKSSKEHKKAFRSTVKAVKGKLQACNLDTKLTEVDNSSELPNEERLAQIIAQIKEASPTLEKELPKKELELVSEMSQLSDQVTQKRSELDQIQKEIKALRAKFATDLEKYNKELTGLETAYKGKLEEIDQHGAKFKYKAKKIQGDASLESVTNPGKKAQKSNSTTQQLYKTKLPTEDLPVVGTLYSCKGKKRCLTISRWSELDLGEKEAERLGAELVCERGEDSDV